MSTRREFIKTGTVAAGSVAFGAAFTMPACEKKDLSAWVTTSVAAFGEIKPLLPQLGLSQDALDRVSGYLNKAVSVAKAFDEAYRAGKFKDAALLFGSLSELITSTATELNIVNNRIVKLALVSLAIARIAIATLLKQQSTEPEVASTIARTTKGADALKAANEIERLAAMDVDKLLQMVKP